MRLAHTFSGLSSKKAIQDADVQHFFTPSTMQFSNRTLLSYFVHAWDWPQWLATISSALITSVAIYFTLRKIRTSSAIQSIERSP
jgi:hypothetical protein